MPGTGLFGAVQNLSVPQCRWLLLSAVSITEIAIKNSIGKLATTSKAVDEIIADLNLAVLPFTAGHAHKLFKLPLHHREPFDRMIMPQHSANAFRSLGAIFSSKSTPD